MCVWGVALLTLSKKKLIWSLRPNYFIFMGYLKEGEEGGLNEPSNPLCSSTGTPHVHVCISTGAQLA